MQRGPADTASFKEYLVIRDLLPSFRFQKAVCPWKCYEIVDKPIVLPYALCKMHLFRSPEKKFVN